jgi:RimJ/RimL family protein N-acetyltransferase
LFIPLPKEHYARIHPLFTDLSYHLIIEAAIIGNSPATVFVDNLEYPKAVFIHSAEGDFLVGSPNNAAFNQGMQAWIDENLINGEEEEIVFESVTPEWSESIQTILAKRPPLAYERYYYEINEVTLIPPPLAPEFKLQIISDDFIAQDNIKNMRIIHEAIEGNWTSKELFFDKGFSLCILHADEIVSWAVVDCVVENRCEIGIHTKHEFQRRGLATALVAAVVDCAVTKGFNQIGWHCWVDNWGSIGVAEKVGLVQKRRYMAYISLQNEMINYAFAGYKRLQVQDYENAEPFYLKAIKSVDDDSRYFLPRVYFEMAKVQSGLGHEEAALEALREALALGLKYSEQALNAPEFAQLKNRSEWQAFFR